MEQIPSFIDDRNRGCISSDYIHHRHAKVKRGQVLVLTSDYALVKLLGTELFSRLMYSVVLYYIVYSQPWLGQLLPEASGLVHCWGTLSYWPLRLRRAIDQHMMALLS